MIWHLDEPSDPIAACQFQAAELAAQHVKVVLGGDGGDELFAGFDRYMGLGYIDYYRTIPSYVRQSVLGPALDWLPESFAYKSVSQKLRWMHQLSAFESMSERYAEATCFFRFTHLDKQRLYSDDLWRRLGHLHSTQVIMEPYNRAEADNAIDRMLYADFMTRLPEHSLMLTDRLTMAHGLEARSPFLDHELVEFMAKVPVSLKIRGRELKYILRKLAVNYLPEQITSRPKQGFMFPIAYWFRHELHDFVKQALLDSFFVREGLFERTYILNLLEEHRTNRVDHHVRLWMLLNLAVWQQIYIEQAPLDMMGDIDDRKIGHP
jgi:asparagine synthase (glutamine-hydrolysing)